MVKIRTKPLLRGFALKQLIDQLLKVLCDLVFIINLIICLSEIKRIMQCRRGKLHSHIIGDIVEGHQILAVHILHGHPKSHIRMSHLHQRL